MKYNSALDGIRGIAVMIVVIFHFGLFGMGWMGVEVFFVLSGFLITRILLEGKNTDLKFYLKRFYWRRSLRIFPLYFGFLFLAFFVWLLTNSPGGTFEQLPYLLTYSFNFAIAFFARNIDMFYHYLWSLSFEEQFYLVWPLLVYFLSRKGLLWMVIALLIFSPLIRFAMAEWLTALRGSPDLVGGMIYYLPFGQFDTFATGALIAIVRPETIIRDPRKIFYAAAGIFLIVGAVNMYFAMQIWKPYFHSSFGYPIASLRNYMHIWMYSVINFMAAGMIVIAIHKQENRIKRFFMWRPLVWVGKVSYGIYILHWPLQMIYSKVIPLSENLILRFLMFLPFLGIVFLVSWLSFRYFESYFIRLKKKKFMRPSSAH